MGDCFVYIDFDARYVMLSHRHQAYKFSLRFDKFRVREDDVFPWGPNNSDGLAV
jgi:late competence protein required for DNA uptake (superfamily II DNA/RNA helicase)